MARCLATGAAVAILAASGTMALAGPVAQPVSGDDWMRSRIGGVGGGIKVERIRSQLWQLFSASDVDGGGVTARDLELALKVDEAQQRAQRTGQKLALDLDGDGVVTREEAGSVLGRRARQPMHNHGVEVMPSDEQAKTVLDRLLAEAFADDVDKDGKLDIAELGRPPAGASKERARYNRQALVPLSLDGNGDGVVSREDYEAAITRVIAGLDPNNDGEISTDEANNARLTLDAARDAQRFEEEQRRIKDEAAQRIEGCNVPKPSAGARVILIGAYEGRALSNVSLGGDDVEVSGIHLDIEAGDVPLYVVATSYEAAIWYVTGATSRIERIVVGSQIGVGTGQRAQPRAGVAGLARDKVSIFPATQCQRFFSDTIGSDAVRARAEAAALLSRPADDVIASGAGGRISLPSGIVSPDAPFPVARSLPKAGPAAAIWNTMLRSQPGGLADLDPAAVVSLLAAKRFAVLPQAAGLAQLVEEGALEVIGSRRVREFGGTSIVGDGHVSGATPSAEYRIPGDYRIAKKMRFPAGLNGGHSVTFILGRGIPYPDGHPGHSKVMSEETGELVPWSGAKR